MRRALTALGLLLVWSIPGLVGATATLILFPNSPTIGGNVRRYLIVSITPWLIWAAFSPSIVAFAKRVPIDRRRLGRTVMAHVLAAVICAFGYVAANALTAAIAQRVYPVTIVATSPGVITRRAEPRPPEPFFDFFRGSISSRFPIGLILYATCAGIGMALHERERRRARESQALRLEADLARAELQTLQMQLQPHFLFNTLQAISMLVDENPKAASRMITQLGDLLRETLRLSGTPEVPLGRELDLLRQYLAIEETRLGSRLTVSIEAPSDLLSISVPSFILQPLVENAVRHGIAPQLESGRLGVIASRAGNCLRIVVSDDGPGFGGHREGGMGLSSTRERLALRYGDRAMLTCVTGPRGGAVVTIDVPMHAA